MIVSDLFFLEKFLVAGVKTSKPGGEGVPLGQLRLVGER